MAYTPGKIELTFKTIAAALQTPAFNHSIAKAPAIITFKPM